jgi:flagellar basal body-associated protein FliL
MKKYILITLFATLFMCVGALYFYYIGVKSVRAGVATSDGKEYIQKMYSEYTIVGTSCQGEDTDRDSYVSCDFRIKNVSNEERVIHLQCPTVFKSYTGSVCKEYRVTLNQ